MARIAILTNAFPYFPGEQFMEGEIPYWSLYDHLVVILPRTSSDKTREIPKNIKVDSSLIISSRMGKFLWVFRAMLSRLFLLESKYLFLNGKGSINNLLYALRATLNVLLLEHRFRKYIEANGKIDLVYSYWNEVAAYAACLLKRKGYIRRVVSRVHGHDLYEYRRSYKYMPLKRQFVEDFDAIYFLSDEGRDYFINTYGDCKDRLFISPLGVHVPQINSPDSDPNCINIVSVSYCIPLKRIDKILEAVGLFADRHQDIDIVWTHIGDGPMRQTLSIEASKIVAARSNLKIIFHGEISNKEVTSFYLQNPVDIFVNASESEGIPVSIMEAMASGVPAIAPDIGGISYLVTEDTGWLMSSSPSSEEICSSLDRVLFNNKTKPVRKNAKDLIRSKYNAEKNYTSFISSICASATEHDDPSTIKMM